MTSSPLTAGILVLNWNGADLLREHLPSVLAAARHSGIAVTVVDNGSTDGSLALLATEFPGVAAIALAENHGFGAGYNLAVAHVDWDVIILLNNDMSVDVDFADHLLTPFERDESLFAVSAQVFFQDTERRREETGRTSARLRHGELECAHLPVADDDALVPVFWLGGGSAAVSRAKFLSLGGFEELYSPFYVEDVDLSFRAWQRGWRTVLAPRSRVIHRHRGSTGRLDPAFVARIVARNRLLFVWLNVRDRRLLAAHVARLLTPRLLRGDGAVTDRRALLAAAARLPEVMRRRRAPGPAPVMSDRAVFAQFAEQWEPAPLRRRARVAHTSGPAGRRPLRVLFFVPMSVYPVSHGGASRIVNSIWGLCRRGHEVHVLSLADNEAERGSMERLPEVASSDSYYLKLKNDYLPGSLVPTVVRNSHRQAAHRLLADAVRRYEIDVVELEYTHSGAYLGDEIGAPTVLVEHDIAYRSAYRRAMTLSGPARRARALFDAGRLYRWELEAARRADLVLTASEDEAELLRRRGITHATGAVPNGVDVRSLEPPGPRPEARDILFVGYFPHPPNTDGLEFFLTRVWPHVLETGSLPSVTVVGSGLATGLASRVEAAGFRYSGFVEDLASELWQHRVFVCPIRYGAGTRIKILEAAAARCAIVSTTLGAEGLDLRDGRDILLADDPAAFAAAIRRLLSDDALRTRLGDSAHDAVQRQFDWPVLAGELERLLYDLVEST